MDPILQTSIFLLALYHFDCTSGYPNGQVESSCYSMVPDHGASAQSSTAPYSLSLSKSTYSAGQRMTVTLAGSSFKGFLIQARSGGSSNPLGSFTASGNAQTLYCTTAASAVSHTSGTSKSSIQVTWVAPSNTNSDIQLRATVVQSERVFWTGILSSKLTYNANDTSDTSPSNSGFQHCAPLYCIFVLMVTILWI
ncbi:hypothetical protein GDO81_017866 [Engystomops pustulosus]|uniref:Reelin domain-containing protein n=1 Tax=Engystomops pustulosus TaxID=76066 RepID=A0AAV7A3G6_ENGPU|nr:hypothetical protein GDO81_017866 [Engystomops pustulosus]